MPSFFGKRAAAVSLSLVAFCSLIFFLHPLAANAEWCGGIFSIFGEGSCPSSSGSSCSPQEGQSCGCFPDSCGYTPGEGTIQCDGSCSSTADCNELAYPDDISQVGQSCSSSPNSCGQTNSGTIQCWGSCSASTPDNSSCTTSGGGIRNTNICAGDSGQTCYSNTNSCGQQNVGTYDCSGSCNASTPSDASCPPSITSSCTGDSGQTCYSNSNDCGQQNIGTYSCSGSCSASTPDDSGCPNSGGGGGGGGSNNNSGGPSCSPYLYCTAGGDIFYMNSSCQSSDVASCPNGCTQEPYSAICNPPPAPTCTPSATCSSDANSLISTDSSCNQSTTACQYGCSNSSCLSAPSGCLSINASASTCVPSTLVRSGSPATLYWNVTNVASCSISGTNGDAWSGAQGQDATSPITAKTTYTITCLGPNGARTFTGSATINLVPSFQEQ